jgi:hypothetical protein
MPVNTDDVRPPSRESGKSMTAPRIYIVEALATFGLLSAAGVAVCTANPFAALAIGSVMIGMDFAVGQRVSGEAGGRGRIPRNP